MTREILAGHVLSLSASDPPRVAAAKLRYAVELRARLVSVNAPTFWFLDDTDERFEGAETLRDGERAFLVEFQRAVSSGREGFTVLADFLVTSLSDEAFDIVPTTAGRKSVAVVVTEPGNTSWRLSGSNEKHESQFVAENDIAMLRFSPGEVTADPRLAAKRTLDQIT